MKGSGSASLYRKLHKVIENQAINAGNPECKISLGQGAKASRLAVQDMHAA